MPPKAIHSQTYVPPWYNFVISVRWRQCNIVEMWYRYESSRTRIYITHIWMRDAMKMWKAKRTGKYKINSATWIHILYAYICVMQDIRLHPFLRWTEIEWKYKNSTQQLLSHHSFDEFDFVHTTDQTKATKIVNNKLNLKRSSQKKTVTDKHFYVR